MINVNGKLYTSYNNIPSNIIKSFFVSPVFEFKLRWENNNILFWEKHYFMMMAQLRRLRLNIPMSFTLEFFIQEIKKVINNYDNKFFIIDIKFANESKVTLQNIEPNLIIAITVNPSESIIQDDITFINEMSLFKDYNLSEQEFTSISYLQKDIKRIAAVQAFENNCNDNIILNDKKNVIGSVLGNVFLLINNKVISSPVNIGTQSSVLSDLFIEHIKNNNFEFSFEPFGVFELQIADELSVLSIQTGLKPVRKYKKKFYEIKRLPQLFQSFIEQYLS